MKNSVWEQHAHNSHIIFKFIIPFTHTKSATEKLNPVHICKEENKSRIEFLRANLYLCVNDWADFIFSLQTEDDKLFQ